VIDAAEAPGLGDQLAQLHETGVLSDEEYAAAKAKLLASSSPARMAGSTSRRGRSEATKESTPMGLTRRSRRTAVGALVSLAVVLALAVVACSGGSTTPTPSPTVAATLTQPSPTASPPPTASILPSSSPAVTSAQVCADLAAFQAALDGLTGLDLESASVRDVLGAIGPAVTSGRALVESARAAFGPEGQALGTALADLQAALQGITGEGSLGDKAATVENAVDEVAAAFDALKAEVAPGCPTPEASGG
jgi:hypothetical protein